MYRSLRFICAKKLNKTIATDYFQIRTVYKPIYTFKEIILRNKER